MRGQRRTHGGGATWQQTSRWRYRVIDQDGTESGWRYADTLSDVRADLVDAEDVAHVEHQVRAGEWQNHSVFRWGEAGPTLERTT